MYIKKPFEAVKSYSFICLLKSTDLIKNETHTKVKKKTIKRNIQITAIIQEFYGNIKDNDNNLFLAKDNNYVLHRNNNFRCVRTISTN